MTDILIWIQKISADFSSLQPTAQFTFVLGFLGFLGATLVGSWQLIARTRKARLAASASGRKAPPVEISPISEKARLLGLVERGELKADQAVELARLMYAAEPLADSSLKRGEVGETTPGSSAGGTVDSTQSRSFTNVVAELATSSDAVNRDVILKFAGGDRDAAIAALQKRAENAGINGAPIWREVAALAGPSDHDVAIEALKKAVTLEPRDVLSYCEISRYFRKKADPIGSLSAAEQAVEVASEASERARALTEYSAATLACGDTSKAAQFAVEAVAEARQAAAAEPSNENKALVLAKAYDTSAHIKWTMGDTIDARAMLDKAVTLYEHILAQKPESEDAKYDRLNALTSKAFHTQKMGDVIGSITQYRQITTNADAAISEHPNNLMLLGAAVSAKLLLAYALDEAGHDDEALILARESEELINRVAKRDAKLNDVVHTRVWAHVLQSRVLFRKNQIDDAFACMGEMVAIARGDAILDTVKSRENLAAALNQDGKLRMELGDFLGAQESFLEAELIADKLATDDQSNIRAQQTAFMAKWSRVDLANAEGDYQLAHSIAKRTFDSVSMLVEKHKGLRVLKGDLAFAHSNLARATSNIGNDDKALEHARTAKELYSELATNNSENFDARHSEFDSIRIFAAYLRSSNRPVEALAEAKTALEASEKLAAETGNEVRLASGISLCRDVLADTYRDLGDFDQSLSIEAQVVELRKKQFEDAPTLRTRRSALQDAYIAYAGGLRQCNRPLDAIEQIEAAETLIDRSSNRPSRSDQKMELVLLNQKAQCYGVAGRTDDRRQTLKQCHSIAEQQAMDSGDPVAQSNLGKSCGNLAGVAIGEGDWVRAAELTDQAELIAERLQHKRSADSINRLATWHRLLIAGHFGDSDQQSRLIAKMVGQSQSELNKQDTLPNRLDLADSLARQVAIDFVFDAGPQQFKQVIDQLNAIEADFPDNQLAASDLGRLWQLLSRMLTTAHLYKEAEECSLRSIQNYNRAPTREIKGSQNLHEAISHLMLAEAMLGMDKIADATRESAEAESKLASIENDLEDPTYELRQKLKIIEIKNGVASLYGRVELLNEQLQEAKQIIADWIKIAPNDIDVAIKQLNTSLNRLVVLELTDKLSEGTKILDDIEQSAKRVIDLSDDQKVRKQIDVVINQRRAAILLEQGEFDQSYDLTMQSLDGVKDLIEEEKQSLNRMSSLAAGHNLLAEISERRNDGAASAEFRLKAINTARTMTQIAPDWAEAQRELIKFLYAHACTTVDARIFQEVANELDNLGKRHWLLGAYPWANKLRADARVRGLLINKPDLADSA